MRTLQQLTLVCVVALIGCKSDHASPAPPAPAASTSPAPARDSAPSTMEVPPPSPQPKSVRGQVIRLRGDEVVATDAVPPGVHGHGEALRAIWTAPDGTTFAVGFMYTGTRGHDTGAVYRRGPTGPSSAERGWQLVYSTPQNELGRIWGRSASDVYAAGTKVLAHFDGKAWTEVTIPLLEGSISGVWGDATDLWVSAGHQYTAHIYHRDGAGSWSVEAKTDVMLFNLGGAGGSVWAVGSSGAVFRRDRDGHWKQEAEDRWAVHENVWASGEDDVWVAGAYLQRRHGGDWENVELPVPGPVRYAWGRGEDDVYVGTAVGLFHLVAGRWKPTGLVMDSAAVSGTADELFVAHNDIR